MSKVNRKLLYSNNVYVLVGQRPGRGKIGVNNIFVKPELR